MTDTSPWLEEVGKGWRPIISPVLERLESDGIVIIQVKEKFGGLRIYVGPASDFHYSLIEEAAQKCAKTCERCGEPGALDDDDGWLRTLCRDCIQA